MCHAKTYGISNIVHAVSYMVRVEKGGVKGSQAQVTSDEMVLGSLLFPVLYYK
jgi:hypothetical protein